MDTIYNLQQRADTLRKKTETESITPEEVGGLHADTLDYLADMEQNVSALGVKKVYKTYTAMTAEGEAPTGTNGKALRYGQLVAVYDADSTQAENGNIYAWQTGTGAEAWLLVGNNLTNMTAVETAIKEEAAARTSADADLQAAIDKTDLALSNAQLALGQQISAVATRVTTTEGQIATNKEQIAANEEQLNTVQSATEQNAADLKAFTDTKDQPGGLATLDDDELIPVSNLPDVVFGILPFDVTVAGVYADGTLSGEAGDGVAYDTKAKRFYAYTQQDGSDQPERFYKYWLGSTHYNDSGNDGAPYNNKVYLNTATHTAYQWNGSGLLALTSRHIVLTQSEYDALAEAGTLEDDVYYNVVEE